MYARAGICEVGILNLPARNIEIYREPHFAGYASNLTVKAGEKASPLAFPEVELPVSELLSLAR